MKHSNYSPSRLSRIIKCPGSVGLIDSLFITGLISESKSTSYAEHGIMLHQILEKHFKNQSDALKGLNVDDKWLVSECIDYLNTLVKSKGPRILYEKSETQVSLNKWGIPDVWGHLDYQITDPIQRHIDIIDWKFGAGVMVYAKKNSQLMAYAAGAIDWPSTIQTITLHVIQPAKEHFDTWDLTVTELYNWVHGTLALTINKCTEEDAKFNPGVEQCRWCEAQNHCYTRLSYAQDIAAKLFHANNNLAKCPKPEDLVKLVELAPLVEKAIKSINQYIHIEMLKGVQFPRLKLVKGRANRQWVNEKKALQWLTKHTEIEEFFSSKMRSPSQMEKEVKSLKINDKFKKLYEKPQGKITLVHESDKRPAIQTASNAIDVFTDELE